MNVVRITEKDDATTQQGLDKAMKAITGENTLLWISIPCTGGCSWQNVNEVRWNCASLIRRHWKLLRRIWANTIILMAAIRKSGGKIAIEWPDGCKYWHWKEVAEVLSFMDYSVRIAMDVP